MEEASSNVRLVRCPKCANLLPELHDFSVYQCGGCGTVLRGKYKGILEDALSEISDNENVRAVSDKGDAAMNLDAGSDFDEESSEFQSGRTKGKIHNRRMVSHNRVVSGSDGKEVYGDFDKAKEDESSLVTSRLGSYRRENLYDYDECSTSKGKMDHGVASDSYWGKINTVESVGLSVGNELKNVRSYSNGADTARHGNFGTSRYPNEGPLENNTGSYYGLGNRKRYDGGFDEAARVADLESNRAELLRKINELKDQLGQTCDISEKPKGRIPIDGRMTSTILDPYSRYPLGPANNFRERPYIYRHQGNVPYTHGSGMPDSYPSNNFSHEFPGFADEYRQQVLRKQPPHQIPYQHFPGPHMDNFFTPHPHETFFHQSTCSCPHCLNQNYHAPPTIQPPGFGFGSLRSRNGPMNSVGYGPGRYTSEHSVNKNYRDGHALTRTPSDLDSENVGLGHQRNPRRLVVAHRVERVYRAIAGGAPFITCCNCFELLKLPSKLMIRGKSEKRMRCGACSSVILFELGSKESGVSVSTRVKQLSADDENLRDAKDSLRNDVTTPWSDDYDYHFVDTKLVSPTRSRKSNSTKPEKGRNSHSSSSNLSEDELSPESMIDKHNVSQKDHACNISPQDVVEKYEKENAKEHTDRSISRQSSVKDASNAVEEIDVSMTEFVNTSVSVESNKSSKEEHSSKSFMDFIKRNIGGRNSQSQRSEIGKSNVFVNGRYIPDRVVKKAEKLAGTIQPGYYWYDYRAGFWGVMGHPCLGVIMPNIEEFNYPIPKGCAAGNTGIYVNGRELNQKDLDLLVSRGLPMERNKSYLVNISGKVVDEHTGEELDGLGKLAPTVERVKHGFGMKVPKAIAEQLC